MTDQNYYEILGLTKDATEKEIGHAYRELSLKYHPDKNSDFNNPDEIVKNKYFAIQKAYDALIYEDTRKRYDDNFGIKKEAADTSVKTKYNFKNEHQKAACENLKAKGHTIDYFTYLTLHNIKNEYQAEAVKYTSLQWAIGFQNKHHITALKNLIEQGKTIDDFTSSYILTKIKNEYQAEALKYAPTSLATVFNNEYQIDALKHLKEQGKTLTNSDYDHIAKIDNHCQSDAIEAGADFYSVLDMECPGIDHSDF